MTPKNHFEINLPLKWTRQVRRLKLAGFQIFLIFNLGIWVTISCRGGLFQGLLFLTQINPQCTIKCDLYSPSVSREFITIKTNLL